MVKSFLFSKALSILQGLAITMLVFAWKWRKEGKELEKATQNRPLNDSDGLDHPSLPPYVPPLQSAVTVQSPPGSAPAFLEATAARLLLFAIPPGSLLLEAVRAPPPSLSWPNPPQQASTGDVARIALITSPLERHRLPQPSDLTNVRPYDPC